MPHPPTFDPSTAEQIITLVSAGNYPVVACKAVGVAKSTMHLWLKKGRDYDRAIADGNTPIAEHECYAKFSRRYDKAHGWALVKLNTALDKATETDWRAAAWKMGKLAPSIYGDKPAKANPLNERIAEANRRREAERNISDETRAKLGPLAEEIADQIADGEE